MDWINTASFWVSAFMALIAVSSVLISYTIYRSSTDPEVILYSQPDKKRPSIINLIVHNIGIIPALNVTFSPERVLPANAFGFENAPQPKEMVYVPLINGIPYIAPGQQFVITWGQYGGLNRHFGSDYIDVNIYFERTKYFFRKSKFKTGKGRLDIRAWKHTDSSDHNWDKKSVEELHQLNKNISSLIKIMDKRLNNEETRKAFQSNG